VTRLDHIGIAVARIEDALPLWRDLLGLRLVAIEEVPGEQVRVAVLDAGGTRIELLEPTDPESPIARHLLKRGPGIHHLALSTADLATTMNVLRDGGAPPMDEVPRAGAQGCKVTFVHPRHTGGVLLELSQP